MGRHGPFHLESTIDLKESIGGNMFDTGKTIRAGDVELFVSDAGKMDGLPIILLHGGLGSRADFEPLARYLVSDYRLIAIDSRGHGRSTLGDATMTYRQLTDDIATILEQLGLNEAGIIGHSDGGIVALRLAASHRARPRFVVAVGAHWQLPDDNPTREIYRNVSIQEWQDMFGEKIKRYENENSAPDFMRLFEATKAMWLGKGHDAYPDDTVRTIATPLLVVNGDDDLIVSREHAFELAQRVEGARLLNLPFASHTVLEDDPTDILPALKGFIDRVQNKTKPTE